MDTEDETHTHDLTPGKRLDAWPDAAWREAFACRRCALRLLLLLLESRNWVARRVERVSFLDDRTVTRGVTTDFYVPPAAPRLLTADGYVRLVPLTVLRRKTLVNFGLQDGAGTSLSLVSMRHNQALTREVVLALAEHVARVPLDRGVKDLAAAVARGTQEELTAAFTKAEQAVDDPVAELLAHDAAGPLVRRFANDFLLLVTVPEQGPPRRLVRFRYDEPLSLVYKQSGYDEETARYEQPQRALPPLAPARLAAALGWTATVIRFPVPAAENAQSFHFEVEAPRGVLIASASMVAGRPLAPTEEPSWDHVGGGFPVVGLHVCDVPNGSRSRAQVLLRLSRAGWLTATLLSSLLSSALLWTVASLDSLKEADAVATALLTVTAAVIVFVVRSQEHPMASRLVSSVRAVGTFAVLLLVLVAGLLTFTDDPPALKVVAGLGTACTVLVAVAWWLARPSEAQLSPWEQGLALQEPAGRQKPPETLLEARTRFGFDDPAIKVASSEGDHQAGFAWQPDVEERLRRDLLDALRAVAPDATPADLEPSRV